MTISGLSSGISANNISSQLSVAILSKQLDQQQTEGAALLDMMDKSMMEQSVTPHIGKNVDIYV